MIWDTRMGSGTYKGIYRIIWLYYFGLFYVAVIPVNHDRDVGWEWRFISAGKDFCRKYRFHVQWIKRRRQGAKGFEGYAR